LEIYSFETFYGQTFNGATNAKQLVFIREPIGVAGMITPWNFPSAMITRKVNAINFSKCMLFIKSTGIFYPEKNCNVILENAVISGTVNIETIRSQSHNLNST